MAVHKPRYYVHGDQNEHDPNEYYCWTCDVFWPKEHFTSEACSCPDHRERYLYSLKSFRDAEKHGQCSRPASPVNVLA